MKSVGSVYRLTDRRPSYDPRRLASSRAVQKLIALAVNASNRASPPYLPAVQAPCRGMVENTGLEPVTSWLQTRRSPS